MGPLLRAFLSVVARGGRIGTNFDLTTLRFGRATEVIDQNAVGRCDNFHIAAVEALITVWGSPSIFDRGHAGNSLKSPEEIIVAVIA